MSLSRDSKAERIAKFLLRKQFQVKQGLERIEFEETVLIPAIEALKSGKSVPQLGLDGGKAFSIVVEDENHTQTETDRGDSGQ
jgi:hypothetical protein